MGNSTKPGSVVTAERELGIMTVDGEQYRVTELSWNLITGRSYDVVPQRSGDHLLTEDGSFDEYPDEGQIRALVKALCAEGKFPDLVTPVSTTLPRTGVPLVVSSAFDTVLWLHDGQLMVAPAGGDGVLWWDASMPVRVEQFTEIMRPLTDDQQSSLISPWPKIQPGTATGTTYCPECTTPDSRAQWYIHGPWHRNGCSKCCEVADFLPVPGTPIALLRYAQCVLWLVRGDQCYAPLNKNGLVDWSGAAYVEQGEWDQDDAENEERTAAADALRTHQSIGALLGIAAGLSEQDAAESGEVRPELWRHVAHLVCAQARSERRAVTDGQTVFGAATRLDWVVQQLRHESSQRSGSSRAKALTVAAEHLARHTEGANYRVTLLAGRNQRHEVVVRATSPQQAAQRVRDADARYLVGYQSIPGSVHEVTSVARLTPAHGLDI